MNKKRIILFVAMCLGLLCACGKEEQEVSTEVVETTTTEVTTQATTKEVEIVEFTTEKKKEKETKEQQTSIHDEKLQSLFTDAMGARSFSGDCSVQVIDLNSYQITVEDSHKMQAASLIKLFIAGAVYEEMENGALTQTGNVPDLMLIMISQSDNDAANSLVSLLGNGDSYNGMQKVNEYCANHGLTDTHMGRLLLAPNDVDDNYTSVADVSAFLRSVYEGRISGASNILTYMKAQQRTTKLPAGIPPGVVTANKTGELADVENDAMIVLSDSHPYIICVMTQNLSDASASRTWITDLSSKVYNHSIEEDAQTEDNMEMETE